MSQDDNLYQALKRPTQPDGFEDASAPVLTGRVQGDSFDRFALSAAGSLLVGDGTSAPADPVSATSDELLDAMYPVGDVITYPLLTCGAPLSGGTLPEVGAQGGSFYAFDKASAESVAIELGGLMPRTWRTVELYLETFNFAGDPAANNIVRWRHDFFGGETDSDVVTLQTVIADAVQPVFQLGAEPYTLGSNTIAGVTKYGGTVVIDRHGDDAADTFDADIMVSCLHAVRVT